MSTQDSSSNTASALATDNQEQPPPAMTEEEEQQQQRIIEYIIKGKSKSTLTPHKHTSPQPSTDRYRLLKQREVSRDGKFMPDLRIRCTLYPRPCANPDVPVLALREPPQEVQGHFRAELYMQMAGGLQVVYMQSPGADTHLEALEYLSMKLEEAWEWMTQVNDEGAPGASGEE